MKISRVRSDSFCAWGMYMLRETSFVRIVAYSIPSHYQLNGDVSSIMTPYLLLPLFRMMTSSNGNIFRVTGPLCGEFTGPGEFPTQRPVTRSVDVFSDLRLNKRLSKQPRGWWFKTQSWSLWRHCNGSCKARKYSWRLRHSHLAPGRYAANHRQLVAKTNHNNIF